jgi:uncharacterized membrane protein
VLVQAVTSYEISLFLHITAAVVGFGTTFAESITFPVAMQLDRRHLPYVHRLQRRINTWFALPALVVILATGFYQVADGDWSLGDAWLSISLFLVLVIAVLNLAYFIPEDRKLEEKVAAELASAPADGEPELSDDYMKAAQREGMFGAATGLMLVVIIFMMVVKPGV